VNDKSRTIGAMIVGAVVGAAAGYMFFTETGRRFRRQLEPALEDMARELNHFRGTVTKAAGVANEGWKLLNDALGEREQRFPNAHQTSPF
jgi:gas vesicle protein